MLKCVYRDQCRTLIFAAYCTHDSDSVIYFQITNPYRAAFGISDLRQALTERAQTTLRHVVGARAVQSVVTEREAIAYEIAEIVGDVADKWGVAIEGILIKDIIFSPEVAASLSSAAQQKRIGESKVIAARAEVDAARLMRQAADILASPAAMQIRQLEACTSPIHLTCSGISYAILSANNGQVIWQQGYFCSHAAAERCRWQARQPGFRFGRWGYSPE